MDEVLFTSKLTDNTVKKNYGLLDQAVSRKNPIQMVLSKLYKNKGELAEELQRRAEPGSKMLSKKKLFDFYKDATKKETLSFDEKQTLFQFMENLRFREDNQVDLSDVADLAFGYYDAYKDE